MWRSGHQGVNKAPASGRQFFPLRPFPPFSGPWIGGPSSWCPTTPVWGARVGCDTQRAWRRHFPMEFFISYELFSSVLNWGKLLNLSETQVCNSLNAKVLFPAQMLMHTVPRAGVAHSDCAWFLRGLCGVVFVFNQISNWNCDYIMNTAVRSIDCGWGFILAPPAHG